MILEALWVAYMLDRVLTSRRCLVIMWRIDRAKISDERLFEQLCPSCVSWSTTWCTRRSGMIAVRGGNPPAPWSAIPRGHQISQATWLGPALSPHSAGSCSCRHVASDLSERPNARNAESRQARQQLHLLLPGLERRKMYVHAGCLRGMLLLGAVAAAVWKWSMLSDSRVTERTTGAKP